MMYLTKYVIQENLMVRYELENILPFNDIYYVDCICLTFFTAIRYFKGSIFSYIANDYFVYKLEQTATGLSLKLDKPQVISFHEMTKNNGIIFEQSNEYHCDIVDRIIDTILNGSIVIMPIDGFYYKHPYHDLFYLKEHHANHILIYGFDSEKEIFKTVEVNGFAWNTKNCCYKHEISFQDLVTCHKGVVNYLQKRGPTLITLSKDNPNKIMNDDPYFYKSIMINNMKLHKNDILEGLQGICVLSNSIENFDIDKTTVFNNKVASLSNQYKINSILGCEHNCRSMLQGIVERWVAIESLIYINEFKGVCEKKKLISELNHLFKLESILYQELFSSFYKS